MAAEALYIEDELETVDFPDVSKIDPAFKIDADWVSTAFMIGGRDFEDPDVGRNQYFSSAARKWTDTRMGGSIGVGTRSQACPFGDIRDPGRSGFRNKVTYESVGGNYGMGRDYSRRHDDTEQIVYMRFGVPEFNSLTRFFRLAFDPNITNMVNTGRPKGFMYNLGAVLGTLVFVSAFPIGTLILVGLRALNWFFVRPVSRYYSLKPTMFTYWTAVSSLITHMTINRGLFPRNTSVGNVVNGDQTPGTRQNLDKATLDNLTKLMPDIFLPNYGIDVFAVITRAQRTYNHMQTMAYKSATAMDDTDWEGKVKKRYQDRVVQSPNDSSLVAWLREHTKLSYYLDSASQVEADVRTDRITDEPLKKVPDGFAAYYDAEFSNGAEFATFRVDHTGSSSITFNNSVKETDLAMKFNSTSNTMRELNFNFAGGNITDNAFGNAVEAMMGGLKDLTIGGLSWMTFGIGNAVAGLLGGGFVDIPKHWDNSEVTLPTASFSRVLTAPYNNPISLIHKLDLYICMLIAAIAPRSTGKQSYGSPFLCQWWHPGRSQASLGIFKSLTIERGVGNLPFDEKGVALSAKVTFELLDLSSIMHMPISTGTAFSLTETGDMGMDEDNILKDYLAVMAGMDVSSQFYASKKLEIKAAHLFNAYDQMTSPARWAAVTHNLLRDTPFGWFGDAAGAFGNATERGR